MVASVIFYAMWTPLPLLLFAAATQPPVHQGHAALAVARGAPRAGDAGHRGTLGVLCTFKYADMFRETLVALLGPLGLQVRTQPFGLLLPVGLSFFTFQAISYVVDTYRGEIQKEHTYFEHLLYLLFFPHLVAGPIVRASHLIERFDETPSLTSEEEAAACTASRWAGQKLIIADVLGSGLVDPVFASPEALGRVLHGGGGLHLRAVLRLLGVLGHRHRHGGALRLQVRGELQPAYLATNLFEFWNRWHISLSNWLRDYLYRPLGGNRVGKGRALFNLMVVMGLGGLWHGADWRFAVWGLAHGAMLVGVRVWWWVTGKPPKEGMALVRASFGWWRPSPWWCSRASSSARRA